MPDLNLAELIRAGLDDSRRPEDGLLHCSTDLLGSLRHAQLRIAGAPQDPEPTAQKIRMMTGTLWHRWIGEMLERKGIPVMKEVNISAGLPDGWSGTLDLLTYDTVQNGHMIRDVKTQKAEAFAYHSGIKPDHLQQISAYHGALVKMGYPMLEEVEVCYVPMNAISSSVVEIVEERAMVLPIADLWDLMEEKRQLLDAYLVDYRQHWQSTEALRLPEGMSQEEFLYVRPTLAPVPEREQRLHKGKTKGGGAFDVVLCPSWRADYCRFAPPLCGCRLQGQTKIGTYVQVGDYDDVGNAYMYEPREGYEEIEPTVAPTTGSVISV